ncbi:membrane-anchored junction protein [Brachyistius frenatus]|uniref:membrane-anchored junction protein n=1 Tax=Brachyistius frenatus TaxID=100188 RepID=UPI0037E7644A
MALQAFSFPFPETRIFKAGSFIYKFKIRGGTSYREEEVLGENCFNQELEEIVRTVLSNLDSLQPFSTTHHTVFPYKRRWEGVCRHAETRMRVYPFILILYLEKNTQPGKQAKKRSSRDEVMQQPESKRCNRDSPLEDAILKDLIEDMDTEFKGPTAGEVDLCNLHAERAVKGDPGHVDKKGTKAPDNLPLKSGVGMIGRSVSPGEARPEVEPDMGEEEEGRPGTPVKRGLLAKLASHIFPLSWFFRHQ